MIAHNLLPGVSFQATLKVGAALIPKLEKDITKKEHYTYLAKIDGKILNKITNYNLASY